VEPRQPNRPQSASDDLLAGYALGILTPEERATVDAQLAATPELRQELALLAIAVDALPLGLEPQEPSPALRDRLEAAVLVDVAASQPPPVSAPATPVMPPPTPIRRPDGNRRGPFSINAWAIAAAVLLVVSAAAVAWGVVQTQQAVPTRVIAFEMTDAAAGAEGQLAYHQQTDVMLLTVEDLPPLPPDRVYEFWLVTRDGTVLPAGVSDDTTIRHAFAGSPDDYQAVAITVEPGPYGTLVATTDPLAVAPLGGEQP
jgi:anti-sigma-K factor RskA